MSFELKDEVWHIRFGNGIVGNIDNSDTHYPIGVKFEGYTDYCWFSLEGKDDVKDKGPSLYHKGTKIVPAQEPSRYDKKQREWIEQNDIKVGDTVKILRGWEDKENGFEHPMGIAIGAVGETRTVLEIQTDFIKLSCTYNFPFFVLEKLEPKYEFKPFERVIVRDVLFGKWTVELFSHYEEECEHKFVCLGDAYKHCLPYKGNEHFLGTTDIPQ